MGATHPNKGKLPMCTHLQRRTNGVYYFRRRVPLDLVEFFGKREFLESLNTKNRRDAELACRKRDVVTDALFNKASLQADSQTNSFGGRSYSSSARDGYDIPQVIFVQYACDKADKVQLLYFALDLVSPAAQKPESLTVHKLITGLGLKYKFASMQQNPDSYEGYAAWETGNGNVEMTYTDNRPVYLTAGAQPTTFISSAIIYYYAPGALAATKREASLKQDTERKRKEDEGKRLVHGF